MLTWTTHQPNTTLGWPNHLGFEGFFFVSLQSEVEVCSGKCCTRQGKLWDPLCARSQYQQLQLRADFLLVLCLFVLEALTRLFEFLTEMQTGSFTSNLKSYLRGRLRSSVFPGYKPKHLWDHLKKLPPKLPAFNAARTRWRDFIWLPLAFSPKPLVSQ